LRPFEKVLARKTPKIKFSFLAFFTFFVKKRSKSARQSQFPFFGTFFEASQKLDFGRFLNDSRASGEKIKTTCVR